MTSTHTSTYSLFSMGLLSLVPTLVPTVSLVPTLVPTVYLAWACYH